MPRAPKTIQKLKEKGKQIYFVTNNSSRSRDTYVERLKKFGIETEKKNVIPSHTPAVASGPSTHAHADNPAAKAGPHPLSYTGGA